MLRREASTIVSPVAELSITRGLPGSSDALLSALIEAEAQGRAYIAEAAIRQPLNNHGPTADFVHSYGWYEAEVADLLASADDVDEGWAVLWARRPSWVSDRMLETPATRADLDVVVLYMALRTRQLSWLIDWLRSDRRELPTVVRHAKLLPDRTTAVHDKP
jgi:hypothetical protein